MQIPIVIIIIIVITIILLTLKTSTSNKPIESFTQYGYSNIEDPMFTIYPLNMIDANYPDKLIKHVRLNHTGSPMYWSYNVPNSNILTKVDCPSNVVDVTNKNYPNSRYNLVCWQLTNM